MKSSNLKNQVENFSNVRKSPGVDPWCSDATGPGPEGDEAQKVPGLVSLDCEALRSLLSGNDVLQVQRSS